MGLPDTSIQTRLPPSRAAARPTRARFVVLFFLCGLAFVLYLDRLCMGQAAKPIRDEIGLSDTRMALVMMAFTLAYGLFEVPTGHWGDRIGARRVLARIVIWWSAFTALTGACQGFVSLLVVRFLFGAGEAGAYPNTARVVARWFPPGERGRVQGLFMASSLIGGTFAPSVTGYLIEFVGWRWTFVIFGAAGVLWVTAFLWWFRDEPARHPAVNAAELGVITGETVDVTLPARYEPIPWGRVLTNRNIWLLGTSTTCGAFTTYLFFSWYPTYLQEGRGLGNIGSGWLTSLVLGAGAVGILCGGVLADLATRFRWDRVRCRRIQGVTAFVLAATSMLASSLAEDPYLSAGYAAGACLFLLAQQAIWWSSATEVSGRHVGALFGLMNGMGVFGAMASQLFFGAFTEWRRDLGYTGREVAEPAFYVYVAVLLVGACCWLFIDPTRRVGHEQEGTADAARDA